MDVCQSKLTPRRRGTSGYQWRASRVALAGAWTGRGRPHRVRRHAPRGTRQWSNVEPRVAAFARPAGEAGVWDCRIRAGQRFWIGTKAAAPATPRLAAAPAWLGRRVEPRWRTSLSPGRS